jgi:parallel beta-helix repeat protein
MHRRYGTRAGTCCPVEKTRTTEVQSTVDGETSMEDAFAPSFLPDMTLTDARKILGLGPDDDPRPHLAEFKAARGRIAEMVRTAPNDQLALRYQEGLVEFDRALAAIRENLESLGQEVPQAAKPQPTEKIAPSEKPAKPQERSVAWVVLMLVIIVGAVGGGLLYLKNEQEKSRRLRVRIEFLEREGAMYVENRRWHEAAGSYEEIEQLEPGSPIANKGRRSIEAGINEEQNQFIGYWTGQAIAELDAGRLDEAEAAARRVIEKFPAETEAPAILVRVAKAREGLSRSKSLAAARRLLEERQWETAIGAARRILATDPKDGEAAIILADATAALEKQKADQARAAELYQQAAALDHGEFDQQALDWLREALALTPDKPEVKALYEKMASYTRTLRVPGDFATPTEALAAARVHDRIVLAEQTWKEPLVINVPVDLQGAGPAATVIECPPSEGCAITIGPDAKGARVSGITFRHASFLADGSERFAAALVRGGSATFVDCHFSDASGHGLTVIERGEAVASRCRFTDNGWNGAAAIGEGSRLEVRESESIENFEHGIESWNGAAVTIINNRCEGNSRNGIHADNRSAAAVIEGNQLIGNREFGLVLDSAGSGKITGNTARGNLLGGFVIRAACAPLAVTGNHATDNRGPGIVLEKGLSVENYRTNTSSGNAPTQVVSDADLSPRE